jgi:uncharacterized Zn finger protein
LFATEGKDAETVERFREDLEAHHGHAEQIEEAFEEAGLSLFPSQRGDLQTACSCPDWSNPCKHIAAVYYLLGEEFDRDPFLIFKLRGMEREELMGLLGDQTAGSTRVEEEEPPPPPEPLPTEPEVFWGPVHTEDRAEGRVSVPPMSAALPKRLGNFPFWRGEEKFLSTMEGLYRSASSAGLDVFLGGKGNHESTTPD